MGNEIAKRLEAAKSTAPFLVEKEQYQMAIDEINRLQARLDEALEYIEDPDEWKKIIYSGHPWHADEDGSTVRVFCENAQVFKAPKKGTQYEEYWPNQDLLKWMLRVMNEAENRGDQSPSAVCTKGNKDVC